MMYVIKVFVLKRRDLNHKFGAYPSAWWWSVVVGPAEPRAHVHLSIANETVPLRGLATRVHEMTPFRAEWCNSSNARLLAVLGA